MPLVVAILASFIAFLDGSIVNVALASIEDEFGGGLAGQQWIVDAYLLALGALILLAGAISDRVGRARSLRIGLAVFGFASLICAVAPGVEWLIAARFLQGVGGALLVPSSLALINSTYAGPVRSKAIGSWTGWTSVAFILGPLVGGVLVDNIGWRWVFAVNLLPVIATLTLMRRLRDPVAPVQGRLDIIGAALVALGLGGIVFALIEQPRLGWASPLLWSSLIVGAALIVAFVIRQRRVPNPLLPLSLFRARNFAAGNATTAAVYAAVGLGIWIITLFLLEVIRLPATMAGLATLPVAVASILFARLFGTLSGRYGPRVFMAIGPVIAASGFAWMLTASAQFNFWTQLLPGIVLYGFGLTITVAPLTAAVLGAVPSAQSGIGSAVNNAIARIAGLIAVAIAGPIIGNQLDIDGFHRAVLTTAGLLAIGGIVAAVGIRNTAHRAIDAVEAAQCSDRPVPGVALVTTENANS